MDLAAAGVDHGQALVAPHQVLHPVEMLLADRPPIPPVGSIPLKWSRSLE